MSVTKSWETILGWVQNNAPDATGNLRSPASEEQLAACESALGVELPKAFRHLYLLHDGEEEAGGACVLDNQHRLMPLEEIVEQAQTRRDFAEATEKKSFADWRADIEDGLLAVSGPVKALDYSPGWIQFTETPFSFSLSGKDYCRCIDLDPAPGGVVGQIIEIDETDLVYSIIADSFEEYLARYAVELIAGRYAVKHSWIRDTETVDPSSWGVPDYLLEAELGDGSIYVPRTSPKPDEMSTDESVSIPGQVAMMFGCEESRSTFFTFRHSDGRVYSAFASKRGTDGYELAWSGEPLTIEATRYDPGKDGAAPQVGDDAPELRVHSISKAG